MAHYEPPHQDLRCFLIQLFVSLVVKELILIFKFQDYNDSIAKIPTACITVEDAEMLARMASRGKIINP